MSSCSILGNGKHLSYEVAYAIQYFRKIHLMEIWRINWSRGDWRRMVSKTHLWNNRCISEKHEQGQKGVGREGRTGESFKITVSNDAFIGDVFTPGPSQSMSNKIWDICTIYKLHALYLFLKTLLETNLLLEMLICEKNYSISN